MATRARRACGGPEHGAHGRPHVHPASAVTKKGVAFKKAPEPEPELPEETGSEDLGAGGYSAIAAGLVANPIVIWSAVTLAQTGDGRLLWSTGVL